MDDPAGGPGDQDTGESGLASADPAQAGEIGVGLQPDDLTEGAAVLQEAADEGELVAQPGEDSGTVPLEDRLTAEDPQP